MNTTPEWETRQGRNMGVSNQQKLNPFKAERSTPKTATSPKNQNQPHSTYINRPKFTKVIDSVEILLGDNVRPWTELPPSFMHPPQWHLLQQATPTPKVLNNPESFGRRSPSPHLALKVITCCHHLCNSLGHLLRPNPVLLTNSFTNLINCSSLCNSLTYLLLSPSPRVSTL